jgi:rsbT co-antagonist protein RsbR
MADNLHTTSEHTLMRDMGINEANIERRKKAVGLGPNDLPRIATLKDVVIQHAEEFTATFFSHLGTLEESKSLLSNRDFMDKARRLKHEHLLALVEGKYGADYVEQRMKLAVLYSKVGLDLRVFLGAFHALLRQIGATVMKQFERASSEGFENFMSLEKVAFFDIGVIVDAVIFERERVIRQQQEAIRELSTPVLQVRERLLLLPIIGVIDTYRARMITENLLRSIRTNRAKVVVVDVTGVATIDSKVANHLLQTISAARLMGATAIVTGLSSDVAQSLVALGIELGRVNTVGDMQGGLEEAERLLGYELVQRGVPGLVDRAHGVVEHAEGNGLVVQR